MRDSILFPIFIIFLGGLMRLVPHVPNFAPITAIALFGGMYMNRKYALILPFIIMVISDFFLGFHDTLVFVYGSFLISGLLGLGVREYKTAGRILLITIAASIQFFIITNLGVFLAGHIYPKTIQGFIDCYVMALPFFRNTIVGDVLFTTSFILAFELLKQLAHKVKPALVKEK
ncbi:MAG: hypothetical protein HZC02_05235 [Candidatus Levybacteria bacterium]|nr:hypothetical protein [Candidatus Levybacteria bacterium]